MCIFGNNTPEAKTPRMPVEYAAQRAPDNQSVDRAGTRTEDKLRAATSTMLTGSQGVGAVDTAGKKVLLGA